MEYVQAHTESGNGKGAGGREVWLDTAIFRHSNGTIATEAHEYSYQLGRTYLVYANAAGQDLLSNVCTRTKPVEDSAEDIAMLDALKSE